MVESYDHLQGKEMDVEDHPSRNLPETDRQERNKETAEKYPWNKSFPDRPKPAMPEFGEGRFK